MTATTEELHVEWRGKLSQAFKDTSLYLDIEGAIRSGKTTLALWKVHRYVTQYPGLHAMVSRWSEENLYTLVRPIWREKICQPSGTRIEWDAREHCDIIRHEGTDVVSRVYWLGLKAGEETSRYGKFRGLTLAVIYVDQAEEVPEDYWPELQGRLSQRGMPHQLILTPNPPDYEHWITKKFNEDNPKPDYHLIRLSTYDNAHNLDPGYIPSLEAAYPPGHAKRGPLLLGQRGLNVKGKPVYGEIFRRDLHVQPVDLHPSVALREAIDFGKHHPCVVWSQDTPTGQRCYLGGLLGEDVFLEAFVPLMVQYRNQWFSDPMSLEQCCDPAGSHDNSQGTRKNGVDVLREFGLSPRWVANSNAPDVRRGAVERLAARLRRRAGGSEALVVSPTRWLVVGDNTIREENWFASALEAGYVWDEHTRTTAGGKSIAVPLKDGYYEHGMNCAEYDEINFGGSHMTQDQIERHAEKTHQRALRRSQQDSEPYRWAKGRQFARAGY